MLLAVFGTMRRLRNGKVLHSFRAEQKFVLKMNFAGARIQKGMIEEQVSDYNVTVTASGKDASLPCTSNDPNCPPSALLGQTGWIE
jgi:hypothetical protein